MSAVQASRSIATTEAFRAIVQQVRSGAKTKVEMFEALKELAKSNSDSVDHPATVAGEPHLPQETPEFTGFYANSSVMSKFSPEDRKKLVSKIIEQRRQQRKRHQSWMPRSSSVGCR